MDYSNHYFLHAAYKTFKSFYNWVLWPIKRKECHYLVGESEMDPASDLCTVKPLKTLADLLNWRPDQLEIVKLYIRASPLRNLRQHDGKKILLCHDFKGNYLTDSYHVTNKSPVSECYAVTELWHSISCFCYFSHYLLTIPPVAWINQAHARGITVIGTFITEWDAGAVLCRLMLADENIWKQVAKQMALIASAYGFEGYLINIENTLPKNLMVVMLEFVRFLRNELRRTVGKHALVIWYDAVTLHGQLAWQNALTEDNACFLNECDGIFLNYSWNESGLRETMEVCCNRSLSDIYVGVDVFGRGMLGGGGFATNAACEAIRRVNPEFSIALFAPGWVMEANETTKFYENQIRFHRECVLPYAKEKPHSSVRQVVGNSGIFSALSPWTGRCDTIYVNGRRCSRFCAGTPTNDDFLIADLSQESVMPFDCSTLPVCCTSVEPPRWSYDAGYTGNGCLCVAPLVRRVDTDMVVGEAVLHHLCLLEPNIGLDGSIFSINIKYRCDMENLRLLPIIIKRSANSADKVDSIFAVGQAVEADAARLSTFLSEIFNSTAVRIVTPILEDEEVLQQSSWRRKMVEIDVKEKFTTSATPYDIFVATYAANANTDKLPLYLQDCFLQVTDESSRLGNVQQSLAVRVDPPRIIGHEILHFEICESSSLESQLNTVVGWKIDCDLENLPTDCRFLIQVRVVCGNENCMHSIETESSVDEFNVKEGSGWIPFALTYHLMVQLNDVPLSCSVPEAKVSHGVKVKIVPFLLRNIRVGSDEQENYVIKLL